MPATPTKLELEIKDCATLATEIWRLSRAAQSAGASEAGSSVRYSIRILTRLLDKLELSLVDLTGEPYVDGLVPEVVDLTEDETIKPGERIIDEVLAPTVMRHGEILQAGQIIIRKSPHTKNEEGTEQ